MLRDDRGRREAPPRLAEGADGVGEGLRAFEQGTRPQAGDEAAAWRRVAQRAPALGLRRWLWSGAFTVLAAGAAAALLIRQAPVEPPGAIAHAPSPVAPIVASRAPATPPSKKADARHHAGGAVRRLALSSRPLALPQGRAALAEEATVELTPRTKARATKDDAWVRVVLQQGQVGLHVAKRVAGGPGFEVVAGAYRFRVLGTRFRVARGVRGGAPVELWVDEGRVAVSHDGRALGVVEAGGHWDARPAVAARPTRPTPAATRRHDSKAKRLALARPAATRRDVVAVDAPPRQEAPVRRSRCAELGQDAATAREAVTCYLGVARGGGLAAETALYEVARLRRDVLGDGAGALEALQLSRARFPAGMLRQEVDLSIVELLPKLNRHREAIDEVARLLAQGGGIERGVDSAAELHVLRGNIYREVLEDFARAERDYAAAEEARAPFVGDATFFRGVCLQALGRADDARATFNRYLAAGRARFADEARRRLQRLGLAR
jgi:hypothetical protein